jgi:hypothetical protein
MYRIRENCKGSVFHPYKKGGIISLDENTSQKDLEILLKKYGHPGVEYVAPVVRKIKRLEDAEDNGTGDI